MSVITEEVRLDSIYRRRADLDTALAQVWEDPMTGEYHAFRKGEPPMIVRLKPGQGAIRRNVSGVV